jgi:hypothetical protein
MMTMNVVVEAEMVVCQCGVAQRLSDWSLLMLVFRLSRSGDRSET